MGFQVAEILKLYESANPNGAFCENLRQKVERGMLCLYPLQSEERTDLDKSDLFVGMLLGSITAIAWAYAIKNASGGEPWLYVATVASGLATVFMIYKGFERKVSAWCRRGRSPQTKASA